LPTETYKKRKAQESPLGPSLSGRRKAPAAYYSSFTAVSDSGARGMGGGAGRS
jgi:hypothetical protein